MLKALAELLLSEELEGLKDQIDRQRNTIHKFFVEADEKDRQIARQGGLIKGMRQAEQELSISENVDKDIIENLRAEVKILIEKAAADADKISHQDVEIATLQERLSKRPERTDIGLANMRMIGTLGKLQDLAKSEELVYSSEILEIISGETKGQSNAV